MADHEHADRHLWEFRWVRDLALLLVVVLLCYLFYAVRAITLPVLAGFGLAYVFNPLITWAARERRVPRWASTAGIMGLLVVFVTAVALAIVPSLVQQSVKLVENAPQFARKITDATGLDLDAKLQEIRERFIPGYGDEETDTPDDADGDDENAADDDAVGATAQTQTPGDMEDQPPPQPEVVEVNVHPGGGRTVASSRQTDLMVVGKYLLVGVGSAGGFLGTAIGLGAYIGLFIVVVTFCFFFFSWKFQPILEWFVPLIPNSARDETMRIVRKMDRSVAGFVRGRLVQSLVLAMILSVGWGIVGVPYWLLLGIAGGLMNLIPYAAVVTWPVAVMLASVSGEFDLVWSVVLPSVVYFVGQLVDGWVIEPLVQGQATDLDPLTVLLAVLIGGSLAGFLGLLVAIPVAACIKIFSKEVVLPRLREYAANH